MNDSIDSSDSIDSIDRSNSSDNSEREKNAVTNFFVCLLVSNCDNLKTTT